MASLQASYAIIEGVDWCKYACAQLATVKILVIVPRRVSIAMNASATSSMSASRGLTISMMDLCLPP